MPTAILDHELEGLFAPLRRYSACCLAVSGGPDSTALMHLAARWAAASGGPMPRLLIATVDHGLREGSAADAEAVARSAAALSLPCRVVRWEGPKPATGIQEAARAARYRMLIEAGREAGAGRTAIVLAHTQDDQAETLLMRLARGSGLDGLAGMAPERAVDGEPDIAIVRPLLGITKARLVATLEEQGIGWTDDPSNELLEFERVRLRRASVPLSALGLISEPLALSAKRLGRARAALEAATAELIAGAVDPHAGAYASIDRARFDGAPEEIRLRLLAQVVSRFGGGAEISLARLEALVEGLAAGGSGASLGGAIVSVREGSLQVFRETGRRGLPTARLAAGQKVCWDNRFLIQLDSGEGPVDVRALGAKAYATLRREIPERISMPARAGATLPSLWAGEQLVSVPHLPALGDFWRDFVPKPVKDFARARASSFCSIEFIW